MSGVGQVVRLGTSVTSDTGAPMNAVTASLVLTLPDDTTTTLDVLNPPAVTGHYQLDYVPELPGTYTYVWQFEQPAVTYEGSFYASLTGAVGILSLAEGKDILNIPDSDTRHDRAISTEIVRATEVAEGISGEIIARRTFVEVLRTYGWHEGVRLTNVPVARPVLMERLQPDQTVIEAVAPPAIWTDQFSILRCARPAAMWGLIRVTYVAGPAVVSESTRGGIEYLLQWLWSNRQGASGRPRVGGGAGGGSEAAMEVRVARTAIPYRIVQLLTPKAPQVG